MCLNGQQGICFQVELPKPDRSKCRGLTKSDPPGLGIDSPIERYLLWKQFPVGPKP